MTGRVVGGKYELLTVIGRGGMSIVWLARDRRLDKLWAIKEVRSDVTRAQRCANRRAILDEADFMKRLDHPAIPRVVDIVEERDGVFVVMDYVEGVPLSRCLHQHGAFPQEEVAGWGIQLCDVLGYLHGRRPPVVYRDLKPGNVMLREDGSVRLIDFGIAVELSGDQGDDGRAIGSPGYSAPEQLVSRACGQPPLDARADVYALGATLFSLVTGEVPHQVPGETGPYGLSLRPIREVDPLLSDGLEKVILRATRPDPDDRYQTVDEMRYDLEHYGELTQAHREAQLRRLHTFVGRLAGAGIAAAFGVCLLGAAGLARDGSYGSLVHEAAAASTEEVAARPDDPAGGEASPAERLYVRAIDVDPSRLSTYEDLLSVYKADQVFSPAESQRWLGVWQRHGRELEDDGRYARLCYDVGVLYLCYYDYLGTAEAGTGATTVGVTGQGAVENATRSAEWFSRARQACDPQRGDYRGLEVGDALDEFAATLVFERIGQFHTRFTQGSREGRDMTDVYRDFWEGLEEVVAEDDAGGSVADRAEPIVQLRLCQVAFETVASPTYLVGLMRAGVSRDRAEALLSCVKVRVDGLSGFVASNRAAAGVLYDEVEGGYEEAYENVSRTFGGPVATLSGDGGD